MEELENLYAKDTKLEPDEQILTTVNRFNIDEPLDIQILHMLAQRPMNTREIKQNLANTCVHKLIRDMKTRRQISVSYKSVQRHSIVYYSVNKLTHSDINHLPANSPIEETKAESCNISGAKINPMIRNPRRMERYNFLVEQIRSKIVIPGYYAASKLIRDMEIEKNYHETMDRKSLKRIILDAVTNKEIETIDVDVGGKNPDIWLMLPGTTRDSEQFREHYNIKFAEFENKNKLISIVPITPNDLTEKVVKKKKKYQPEKKKSIADLLIDAKDVDYESQKISNFDFPKLPSMAKTKILHEFIWYISFGYLLEPDYCAETKMDNDDLLVYSTEKSWRRYVGPLPQDKNGKTPRFGFYDILARIPLTLLCLITTPKMCNQALLDHLSDETLRYQTVGNLINSNPAMILFLLNHYNRLCRRNLAEFLERFLDMGLLSKHDVQCTNKEKGIFSINREVFVTDTSNYTLPINDEEIWRGMARSQWILRTKNDVGDYWATLYNICISTRTKMGYQAPAISIVSKEYSESMRNSEYISEHIIENGPVSVDHIKHIRQFGAWLPMDSLMWKNVCAAGYYRSIVCWDIKNWCPNDFDKACDLLPKDVSSSFRLLSRGIFMEPDQSIVRYSSIPNTILSCILNEVNIVLIAVSVLHYDTELDFFWAKMRKCQWFRGMFPSISSMAMSSLQSYIRLLTTEHKTERQYLIDKIAKNDLIQRFLSTSKTKSCRQENWIQEVSIVKMVLIKLIKIHQFIPQWDSLPLAGNKIGEFIDEIKLSNVRLRMKFEEPKKSQAAIETNKRVITPDSIDNIASIINLCLIKYLTGCLHPYLECGSPDLSMRNTIFSTYSIATIISAINSFGNYYALEPLKANKVTMKMIKDGYLDCRLRKLASRFTTETKCSTFHDRTFGQYLFWSQPPQFDGHKSTFKCHFNHIHMKDLFFAFSFLYVRTAQHKPNNVINVNLTAKNFAFNDKKHKMKTVCHSSVYSINLKDLKVTDADWTKMTKDSSISISMGKGTYKALYNVAPKTKIWRDLSRFITLTKPESDELTVKKMKPDCKLTQSERVLHYIEEGEFGGRNYTELQKKFPQPEILYECLEKYIRSEEIFVVGMQSFHFVSKDFIRPWLVKIPSTSNDTKRSDRTTRKRTRSVSNTDNSIYFFPEFYRDETSQFKCVTFKEIINKVYLNAHKTCGATLAELIADVATFLGVNVARQIVNVLVEYNVIELVQLKRSGKAGLFSSRVMYSVIETCPFDNGQDTTFTVNPLSHLSMSNLIRDMSQYFCVNLKESMSANESVEESKIAEESTAMDET